MPPRKNKTFSHQQNICIVTNCGEFESSNALRREFGKHFKLSPRQLPQSYAFSRVINRLMDFLSLSNLTAFFTEFTIVWWFQIYFLSQIVLCLQLISNNAVLDSWKTRS